MQSMAPEPMHMPSPLPNPWAKPESLLQPEHLYALPELQRLYLSAPSAPLGRAMGADYLNMSACQS